MIWSSAVKGAMMNLKLANIIKDEEDLVWESPFRDIFFHISRVENTIGIYKETWGRYIITIDVKNNLGTTITQIRFSELDAIRILDSMTAFTEWGGGSGESMYIQINPNTTQLYDHIFYLQRLNLPEYPDDQIIRDIKFDVNSYSKMHGQMVPLTTILLCDEELNDLVFKIFFVALLDVQMDPDNEEIISQLAERIVVGEG